MKEKILYSVQQGIEALSQLIQPKGMEFLQKASIRLASCFQQGNKLLLAGNGGSLCDAAHFAEELTGYFRKKRPALPALVLSEPGHLTCVANDVGYEQVFCRGIEAFGKPGDVFIGLTTSGNSPNIVKAFETAKRLGLTTISFLGKSGGQLRGVADLELLIEGFSTSDRIQEAHLAAIHILIELVETILFEEQTQEKIVDEILSTLVTH